MSLHIIVGFTALASGLSILATGDLVSYPALAAAAFAGGALAARMSPPRSVVEGAIAAVISGVLTPIGLLVADNDDLAGLASSEGVRWIIGAGAVSLVAAVIGGRVGERFSSRPPRIWAMTSAVTATLIGLAVTTAVVIAALGGLESSTPVKVFAVAMTFLLPTLAAILVDVWDGCDLGIVAMVLGPFALSFPFAALLLWNGAPLAVICLPLCVAFYLAIFGGIGLSISEPIKFLLGPIPTEAPAKAIARD